MCAIWGWYKPAFPPEAKPAELLRHLARKAQPFGDRSFGMATLLPGKDALVRYAGPASEWLAQNSKEVARFAKSAAVIGHARLPTHGAVTRTNCHPFTVGDWVGAHNGVISNSNELLLRAAFIPKGETDSESALCWLATHDFGREAVEKLEGNYAIAAMAKDGSRLVLAVDAVTTLHVAWVGRGLIWHKSGEALESSLTAARIRAQVEPLRSRILRLPGPEVEELATRSHGVGAPLGGDRSRALWLGGNEPF